MARTCCLAGIAGFETATIAASLRMAGARARPTIARVNVAELRKLSPDLMICDIDRVEVDRLELLRQLRFVLPGCIIAIYTEDPASTWAFACHLAGANCVLSKKSTEKEISCGLRDTMRNGCFTDPRFNAA